MAGRVRVAGVDRRVQRLDGFERILFEYCVGLAELGRPGGEGGGLAAQRTRRGPHEHGESEIEHEEDERDGGPDRVLVRADQVVASLWIRVDLIGPDGSLVGGVLDRRIDLE